MREFRKSRRAGLGLAVRSILYVPLSFVHVLTPAVKYGRDNWRECFLLALGLLVLCAGYVRLADYSVPMLRGDYEAAGRDKRQFDFQEPDSAPAPDMFARETLFDRTVVFLMQTSARATDTVVGERVAAKFNHGFFLYRENRYDEAVRELNRAYAALCDRNGKADPAQRRLASEIQLLIGNACANLNKTSEAVNAYQLSLTFDPDNLVTIYNLERLLAAGGGKGGDQGDKPKPSNPANTKL